ncbi:MAG: hypothetical protein HRT91_01445 [Piscirickettsiaceae bacterium]|nr:hypothetical protein [Piscirickettsiaceae bacterium]
MTSDKISIVVNLFLPKYGFQESTKMNMRVDDMINAEHINGADKLLILTLYG